jgi:hypothetical protein
MTKFIIRSPGRQVDRQGVSKCSKGDFETLKKEEQLDWWNHQGNVLDGSLCASLDLGVDTEILDRPKPYRVCGRD